MPLHRSESDSQSSEFLHIEQYPIFGFIFSQFYIRRWSSSTMAIHNSLPSFLTSFEFYVVAGLLLTVYQLKQFEKREKTSLENGLNREYRDIMEGIPVNALLNNEVEDWSSECRPEKARLGAIYPYIDLSNQQIFLRKRGRITKTRWKDWEEGIKIHLDQPEFERAWTTIKEETDGPLGKSFEELRQLESEPQNFDTDPFYWGVAWWHVPFRKALELLPIL